MTRLRYSGVGGDEKPGNDGDEARASLAGASQHLIYDRGDHKQHVDSERPKEELLKPPQVTPGNRLLLDSG